MSRLEGPLPHSRRAFLRLSATGLLAWAWQGLTLGHAFGSSSSVETLVSASRGQVALIRDQGMADEAGGVKQAVVQKWITQALERITGQREQEAWKALFRPSDRVAIKVNALGGPRIATSPQVALAIVQGLMDIGLDPKQVLIWDRSGRELRDAGYAIQEDKGPLCFGTDRAGYEPVPRMHGSIGSCFSQILTRWATALVNVPVLKDHDLSGISLSMKNLYGVIHNPNKYHDSGCSPYLADLLGSPEIQGKLRLIVCDAHRGQCQGGPAHVPKWVWPYRGLLVGMDSVALDAGGTRILEERRREVGLPTLAEAGRPVVHIQAAQERGLGEGRLEAIRIHELGG